jgi:hypothetical protein
MTPHSPKILDDGRPLGAERGALDADPDVRVTLGVGVDHVGRLASVLVDSRQRCLVRLSSEYDGRKRPPIMGNKGVF